MSKPTLKTHSEIVHPGLPSPKVMALLAEAGAKITDSTIATLVGNLERLRTRTGFESIKLGVAILAKKQTLKHGEFQKWAAVMLTAPGQIGGASDLNGAALDNLTRSLRIYSFLAQHFLADLEQNNFQPDARDQLVQAPQVTAAEVLSLDTLPVDRQLTVAERVETFVAGRSLRRMLLDFRRAENWAEQEEIDEASRRKKSKAAAAPGQLDFFNQMLTPIGEIENLFSDQAFVKHTDKAFWTDVAEKLESQAKRARQMAKEIKG